VISKEAPETVAKNKLDKKLVSVISKEAPETVAKNKLDKKLVIALVLWFYVKSICRALN
jgi:hypothetical protein